MPVLSGASDAAPVEAFAPAPVEDFRRDPDMFGGAGGQASAAAVPVPCGATAAQCVIEVLTGGDPQLGEHLPEVPFDGAGTEEQFHGDFGIGASVAGQSSDVLFLRGKLSAGVGLALANLLACCRQRATGALGEGLGAHRGEQAVGGAQRATRGDLLAFLQS
jgi:hypothetical protein